MKPNRIAHILVPAMLCTAAVHAETDVFINGQQLTEQELTSLQQQLGPIAPGYYSYDENSGCWVNLSNGTSGCLGNANAGIYTTPYGSGETYRDGSWNYYSNPAGGGVGGTSDGCIYTTYGWSNC